MDQQPGTSIIPQPQRVSLLTFLRHNPDAVTHELRLDFKNKRPTPKLTMRYRNPQNHSRYFQYVWYSRFPWLTGCNEVNKMFCFKCMLFGSKSQEWCKNGIGELNNFIRRAIRHQSSRQHLLNEEKFHLLGMSSVLSETARLQAVKYNEEVRSNREVLGRVIQTIIYLSRNELSPAGRHESESSNNKGNYLSLLDLLAQNESKLRDHLNSSSVSKWTSPEIRNELIEVITTVVNEKISAEIQQCHFVSVQADETLDVSCKRQMSIILRYCIKERIVERFLGFYDISQEDTAAGLSKIVIDVLKKWDIPGTKVISQTYDGSVLLAGSPRNSQTVGVENSVQHLVRQEYCPHALFVHSHAHHSNLLMLHGSKNIKEVKLFICDLTSFQLFFSKFSKRAILLTEKGFKLPKENSIQWNLHTRAVSTIINFFTELHQVFDSIIEDVDGVWDCNSISCARGLKRTMEDPTFVFLLFVYEACFSRVKQCFLSLRSLTKICYCQEKLDLALKELVDLRNESFVDECFEKSMNLNKTLVFTDEATQKLTISTYEIFFDDRKKQRLHFLTYEILDTLVNQLKLRFADVAKLSFVEIATERFASMMPKSHNCNSVMAKEKVADLLKLYPFFELEKLPNELHIVYLEDTKCIAAQKLLEHLISTGLDSVYVEVVKLLQLVLTFPIIATNNEKSNASTLNRVKTYLRNAMADNRLSNLSTLAVEKELVTELSSDSSFLSRVIDVFAEKTNRMDLAYKVL